MVDGYDGKAHVESILHDELCEGRFGTIKSYPDGKLADKDMPYWPATAASAS